MDIYFHRFVKYFLLGLVPYIWDYFHEFGIIVTLFLEMIVKDIYLSDGHRYIWR